ncbi:MAG: tRNA pseudouridine(55) synthase TruB [Fusobacteriaceae bacterium]
MDGIICVNKPQGITSFDVIRKLRRILREKRIGHTGTLDPLATGVLIVCIGKATKLVSDIEGYEKDYLAGFQLGYKTDTYDTEGVITEESDKKNSSEEELKKVLENFKGDILQIPPMYSAIKIDGQKLYDLARAGITVERKPRPVTVKKLELLDFNGNTGKLNCSVSKGTYIRSLIFDIGEILKSFATMNSLVRTRVGTTYLKECFTLEEIEDLAEKKDFCFLKDVESYFKYPKIYLENEEQLKYYKNGNSFNLKGNNGNYSVYYNDEFLGLGSIEKNRLKSYKYF